MSLSASPIGVFDSGLGGLSVAGRFLHTTPTEPLLYFADTIHVPYGGRPLEEVKSFALSICDFLVAEGAKMIVMACNISSAIALADARCRYPDIPIIGVVEPGSASAVATGAERIGVLATQGTVSSGAYSRIIHRLSPDADVTEVACPRFVPLVESGSTGTDDAIDAAIEYLTPIAQARCQTIVLGCTHYPFLSDALQVAAGRLFGDNLPTFLDPAIETVRAAADVLQARGLAAPSGHQISNRYCVSADPAAFSRLAPILLGAPVGRPEVVTLPESSAIPAPRSLVSVL